MICYKLLGNLASHFCPRLGDIPAVARRVYPKQFQLVMERGGLEAGETRGLGREETKGEYYTGYLVVTGRRNKILSGNRGRCGAGECWRGVEGNEKGRWVPTWGEEEKGREIEKEENMEGKGKRRGVG